MGYQNYRKLFQFLKWIQLSFSFMIFILEMIELGAYLNYVDKVSHDDKLSNSSYKTLFFNSDLGSSLVKKYLYFVFSFNILSTGMYIALYQGSWTEQKGPFAWFEMLVLSHDK
ncbi:6553_t:CDS:2 [Gigaspora rosea]|nr:6553_t:CDS:2 [Gigaspora rosea]